ncbi:MAG: BrnT family toxin [bacterium]
MKEIFFDWDQWNIQKNEVKHGISRQEAESAFYDPCFRIFKDEKHSVSEDRWIAFGESAYNSILMIAFTVRNDKIRIISARKASKRERDIYETKKK